MVDMLQLATSVCRFEERNIGPTHAIARFTDQVQKHVAGNRPAEATAAKLVDLASPDDLDIQLPKVKKAREHAELHGTDSTVETGPVLEVCSTGLLESVSKPTVAQKAGKASQQANNVSSMTAAQQFAGLEQSTVKGTPAKRATRTQDEDAPDRKTAKAARTSAALASATGTTLLSGKDGALSAVALNSPEARQAALLQGRQASGKLTDASKGKLNAEVAAEKPEARQKAVDTCLKTTPEEVFAGDVGKMGRTLRWVPRKYNECT